MNTTIHTYQDLTAWQKAMALVKDIYQATQSWPREELYGLTNQAAPVRSTPARRAGGGRRAAVSVPANIAEGKGRIGSQELLHHLSIATGSLAETETLLLIARDLGYIRDEDTQRLLSQTNTVGQLIGGLRHSLRPLVRR
ncbi:MAG TPA: four helix bundle protein [Chloroflexota bacterium]|nr:four helix bundle protein [Chloroflexota bacterium]